MVASVRSPNFVDVHATLTADGKAPKIPWHSPPRDPWFQSPAEPSEHNADLNEQEIPASANVPTLICSKSPPLLGREFLLSRAALSSTPPLSADFVKSLRTVQDPPIQNYTHPEAGIVRSHAGSLVGGVSLCGLNDGDLLLIRSHPRLPERITGTLNSAYSHLAVVLLDVSTSRVMLALTSLNRVKCADVAGTVRVGSMLCFLDEYRPLVRNADVRRLRWPLDPAEAARTREQIMNRLTDAPTARRMTLGSTSPSDSDVGLSMRFICALYTALGRLPPADWDPKAVSRELLDRANSGAVYAITAAWDAMLQPPEPLHLLSLSLVSPSQMDRVSDADRTALLSPSSVLSPASGASPSSVVSPTSPISDSEGRRRNAAVAMWKTVTTFPKHACMRSRAHTHAYTRSRPSAHPQPTAACTGACDQAATSSFGRAVNCGSESGGSVRACVRACAGLRVRA